ncbi:hypothetical protein [Nonomuraea sp. SBT364]|uniref:hypothetical protein n=1 Tax=Nonomuraea sp. SBT364 TaxID=1580530 RepID=UPI0009EC4EEF|nr:hypothetical protein [Nonomuraea sp. SBT364]
MRGRTRATALALTTVLTTVLTVILAGCGTAEPARVAEPVPHGYVEGAEEAAEPQSRLVLADPAGAVHVLDLITGKVTGLGGSGTVDGIEGDGRFAYVRTGDRLRVVDSGAWTVDHGDHVHYYRSAPRDVGTVAGRRVAGDAAVTAVSGDGTVLLDRARLERGEIVRTAELPYDTVLPYEERLLVPGENAVVTRTGEPAGELGAPCPEPRDAVVTRRGAVFACADGALLVGRDGAEKIRYPDGVGELHARPGSTVLAAKAGDRGVLVVDVTAKTAELLRTGPVVAVTATGPESPVLALTADGVLHAWDPGSGKRLARTRLPASASTRTIQADTSRAYVNDPAGRAVHEIDYNDGLRRARTFELGFAPAHMVETGR